MCVAELAFSFISFLWPHLHCLFVAVLGQSVHITDQFCVKRKAAIEMAFGNGIRYSKSSLIWTNCAGNTVQNNQFRPTWTENSVHGDRKVLRRWNYPILFFRKILWSPFACFPKRQQPTLSVLKPAHSGRLRPHLQNWRGLRLSAHPNSSSGGPCWSHEGRVTACEQVVRLKIKQLATILWLASSHLRVPEVAWPFRPRSKSHQDGHILPNFTATLVESQTAASISTRFREAFHSVITAAEWHC